MKHAGFHFAAWFAIAATAAAAQSASDSGRILDLSQVTSAQTSVGQPGIASSQCPA